MKTVFLVMITIVISAAQTQVKVYVTNRNEKIGILEKYIIEDVLNLYNKQNTDKFSAVFIKSKDFKDMFDIIDKEPEKNNMFINSISVTQERLVKYDFGCLYLPVKNVIITHKNNKFSEKDWQKKGVKIGYTKATIGEKIALDLEKKFGIIPVSFTDRTERVNAVMTQKLDYIIGDNIIPWEEEKLKIVNELPDGEKMHLGVMFAKNSDLKKKLDKIFNYYLKSPSFYKRINEVYGTSISEYIKQNL